MTATVSEAPELRGTAKWVHDSVGVVLAGALLPFAYATWWFGRVTRELRAYGRDAQDEQLSRVSAGRAASGILAGWILVVPAVVVMITTARRVQRAEGVDRSISGVIGVVVAGQVVGLACVAAGWAIVIPVVMLASAVVVMGLLQPRLNAVWTAAERMPGARTTSETPSRSSGAMDGVECPVRGHAGGDQGLGHRGCRARRRLGGARPRAVARGRGPHRRRDGRRHRGRPSPHSWSARAWRSDRSCGTAAACRPTA